MPMRRVLLGTSEEIEVLAEVEKEYDSLQDVKDDTFDIHESVGPFRVVAGRFDHQMDPDPYPIQGAAPQGEPRYRGSFDLMAVRRRDEDVPQVLAEGYSALEALGDLSFRISVDRRVVKHWGYEYHS